MTSATSTKRNVSICKFLAPKNEEAMGRCWKELDTLVLLKMLEEGTHADITFTTEDHGSVKAHRNVLACVSPVFNAMFEHDMKEKLTSAVNIHDMTTDGLQLFLILIYATTELQLDICAHRMPTFWSAVGVHYAELCMAFSKYQVKHSRVRCVLECALVTFLSLENCLHYYDILLQLESDPELCELFKVTENYIVGNYNGVVESPSFLLEMERKPRQVYQLIKSAEPPDRRDRALQCFKASQAKFHTWSSRALLPLLLFDTFIVHT